MIEIEFAHPHELRIWPRAIWVRRLWLGVTDGEALIALLSPATTAHVNATPQLELAA